MSDPKESPTARDLRAVRVGQIWADADPPLTGLIKRHYDTGCYGHMHLRMRREDFDAYPRPPQPEFSVSSPLADLMAIPVVVDNTLPDGAWQLVDNSTKQVLLAGSMTAEGRDEVAQPNASDQKGVNHD